MTTYPAWQCRCGRWHLLGSTRCTGCHETLEEAEERMDNPAGRDEPSDAQRELWEWLHGRWVRGGLD